MPWSWRIVVALVTGLLPATFACAETPPPSNSGRVALSGSILLADGRPIFPRIIQHQGEPLDLLARLGFNAVWLRQPATDAVLTEAKRLGLWVICPPPSSLDADGPQPPIDWSRSQDVVLAWDLGGGLSGREVAATAGRADRIRMADRAAGRPLVCRPKSDLRAYSRAADVLLLGRHVLATGLGMSDYGIWLRQRPRLARPGTPMWSAIETQPSVALLGQWAALAPGERLPTTFAGDQIRLMVYTAITSGSRGLLFESHSRLDASDPDTARRAAILELLNLELGLAEPWLAAGTYVDTVATSDADVLATIFRTDRARLVVPVWSGRHGQFAAGEAAEDRVSFIVPGVPEEYQSYHLAAGGMAPLRRSREAGGVRVTLDDFDLTAMVVLAQDPLVVNRLTQQAAQIGRRAAELRARLAATRFTTARQVHAQLAGGASAAQTDARLAAAGRSIGWSNGLLAARRYEAADDEAGRAMRALRMLERSDWTAAVGDASPLTNAATVSFRSLPWNRNAEAWATAASHWPNRLPGGDFEDLAVMLQSGWTHVQPPAGAIVANAELATEAARSGKLGLRLAAELPQANADAVVETPPVWITSPPTAAEAGQVLRIHGWVNVPQPIAGSVDGLLIIDSITGDALAQPVVQTDGWQEFQIYRAAPRSDTVTLTFALSGLGEAWVDDVTVQCQRRMKDEGRGARGERREERGMKDER